MGTFCTKCGAVIPPDSQFCTACGNPVSAAAPAAPAAQAVTPSYSQPYAQSYAQTAAAPPSKGGSSAMKIILIIVAVLVFIVILIAGAVTYIGWRVSRAVHVDGNGDKVTLHTPGGSISTDASDTPSASELGTDIYPGATSGHGSMKMDLPTGSMVTGVFETTDSKEQVLSFYKSKLGGARGVIDTPETAILTLKKGDQESVMVTITNKPSENDGKTQIAIVHTKSTKP